MRGVTTVIGMLIGLVTFAYVILSTKINPSLFLDIPGLTLVVFGTVAAIFLSYSFSQVRRIMLICTQIFLKNEKSFQESATDILEYCKVVKANGFDGADPSKVHPFLNDCLLLLKDGYSSDDMRRILQRRIGSYHERENYDTNLLRSMAKYPPAFGMLGTVIGLIALMANIGSGLETDRVGQYMAIALTTTLYGVAFANLIFKPMADNLEMRSYRSTKVRMMILDACILLNQKASLVVIQDTINAYLSASETVDVFGGQKNAA